MRSPALPVTRNWRACGFTRPCRWAGHTSGNADAGLGRSLGLGVGSSEFESQPGGFGRGA